uniref:DNA-directed RNA polymerase n=1 Tax=Jaculus jaculus TaxID=51337 RepID=A0A8C5KE54_JACJA
MALCWGRGAAGLSRALRSSGCARPVAEERGTLGGLWGSRRNSTARPCEHDRRKDWGLAELLEVLEARVQQLQAESGSGSEAVGKQLQVSRPAEHFARWAKKLHKDHLELQVRRQRLERKLKAASLKVQPRPLLRVEPQLQNSRLASCLQEPHRNAWEELLARALQEVPQKLSCEGALELWTLQQKLLFFFKGCLASGHLPLAHHVLVSHHSRPRKQLQLTLAMYNTVMLGWARQGSLKELVYVFFMLKDSGLTPDLLSYASALQCMGRRDQDTHTIRRCLDQMVHDGLQPTQIFTDLPLLEEERAAILRAVVKAKPTFSLPPQPSPQVNTSELLREVYSKDEPVSYPKMSLPLETLKGFFQQQLQVELTNNISVQSVDKAPQLTKEVLKARKTLETLREQWKVELLRVLQETKTRLAREARSGRPSLYPFLCLLEDRELVDLLLQALHALPAQGESLIRLAHDVGLQTFNRHSMKQRQLSHQVKELEQRYFQYLQLLASDTQIGILKPHPAFTQLLATAAEPTLIFEAKDMPMLCPPLPWTSPHAGAFLLSSTKLMRAVEGTRQHQRLLECCPPAQLHGALDTLTQLGNCAWRVNGRVLDLVLQVFRDKGSVHLGVPPPASEAPQPPELPLPPDTPPARKAEVRRELVRCLKVAREMHSLRADALYRLSLAQHLRDHVFWLPHNMDFRGRTYPCPPHFNHLGSDLARALLRFAEGKPLGPRGLDWLKIHLVNLTGLRKRDSLQNRLAFANEVMDDILDSLYPLSSDPATFLSHLPVHQDGSCNGLQHYAALGRDSAGASSVNLLPSDLPQDVYSEVAAQVEVFRRQDAEQGVRVAQVLEGFISRKVVKQTVMTVVYGVTRYGGRLQIAKRLRELSDFPQEFVWEASHYLVCQVFQSLQEMFSSTRAIQHWLTQSARLISQAGWAVEWVTPLGVPVIQPYHHNAKFQMKGGLQTITCASNHDTNQRPNTVKQKNGFPPNFIHSLDSSHMMLTALHCYRKGLTFVSVHDCFWTHAADISVMNEVCREQFVRLHSQPILEDLAKFLVQRFCSGLSPRPQKAVEPALFAKLLGTLQAVPKTGALDLEQVKRSTYFFS